MDLKIYRYKPFFKYFYVVFTLFSVLNLCAQTLIKAERTEVSELVGYVPNKILIKLSSELLSQIDNTKLSNDKLGIKLFDKIGDSISVNKIVNLFPNAELKKFKNKEINLAQWFSITTNSNMDIQSFIEKYNNQPGIISVQPIEIHTVNVDPPNDPSYSSQWHLNQVNDSDIDALEAWEINSGSEDIIVAILDTGVRYYHKDLGGANASSSNPENSAGNMGINTSEKNGAPGIDDDSNGFIDDWIAWDFVTGVTLPFLYFKMTGEDYNIKDNDPRDFNGHGTHCAGIVGAINNNGYGISSPSGGWNNGTQQQNGNGIKIMPLRIGYSANYLLLGERGLVQLDFAANALYYAADNGAKIASCSWGSSNNEMLADAIDYFLASGGLIFKAAGNDNNEQSDYMSARNDIITVASTDENDIKSSFSTYGSFVDISAPGSNILSTYHNHQSPANDYLATLSGTSMATPLAASVAALIWSKNPTWTASQVKQMLFESSDNIYSLSGNSSYTGKLGAGRVNAFNALSDKSVLLKVFLEGAYIGSSTMITKLNTLIDFPKNQPFNTSPWNYRGNEKVESIPNNIVDWILIELRDKNNTGNTIFRRPVFLLNTGNIVDLDGSSQVQFPVTNDNYYIVINQKNHIPIMSSATVHIKN